MGERCLETPLPAAVAAPTGDVAAPPATASEGAGVSERELDVLAEVAAAAAGMS